MAKNKKLNFPVNEIKDISDRELAERQYGRIRTLSDNVASIKGWIIFWSIVSILSAVLFFLAGFDW